MNTWFTDHIYWVEEAPKIYGPGSFSGLGPVQWQGCVFEVDYAAGRLTACLVCQKPYPAPQTIAEGRNVHRPWYHARSWAGPTGKGYRKQYLTGCVCLPCMERLYHDTDFYNQHVVAQHVASELEDQPGPDQA